VPYFSDATELYACLGALFSDIVEDPDLSAQFRAADTIVQYRYSDPEAQITVKLLAGSAATVDLGPTTLEPEVVMSSAADIAHRFWLGKLSVGMALARGQIKTSGPVAKLVKLGPAVKAVYPRYRALLETAGRGDLVID
jgi:hypothetical protein